MAPPWIALLAAALLVAPACDRRVEPFDPDERVEAPDLSRIFPPGAERAAAKPDPARPAAMATTRGAPPPGAETSGAPIRGTVRLAPDLDGRVPSGAVLFLIARAGAAGPPVAVKRIPDPRFPLDFEIGPGDRMIEAIPFEGSFELSARVDADRNAMTRTPGDLQGKAPGRHPPGARDVDLLIDEVL